ncbi:MAG: Phenylalanine--tRNA ligase beta subunit [Turneriella sp.]|nr:Phenylalanine--tRNA ligase beta subunit [Turneriella sp.]
MKLSFNWLNEFVDLSQITPSELANLLTMKTCEVEGLEEFMPHLEKIPVAHIDKLEKHPNADKLKICTVNTGKEIVQIVTGADNVEQGKKFPAALVGTKLPDGRQMAKAKLRGIDSFGMLCSGSELGITQLDFAPAKIDGLMPLPDDWKVGASLSEFFGKSDIVFEIDNKSITHRPDLWSHFGFAREIAALLNLSLKKNPEQANVKTVSPTRDLPKIEIEKDAAITYCGAEISGFKVMPSPLLRQMRLLSVGQKPINNIVDISNYILFEMGQPNHAFDRDKISGPVSVSFSKEKESLALLDGSTHTLPKDLVVIRDAGKPVALAGVMGGSGSETTTNTIRLFLESATFPRALIRNTVRQTGIRSDSSQRFEKAQDPQKAKAAIYRFAEILGEEQKGITLSTIAEVSSVDFTKTTKIHTTNTFINQKLGKIENRKESNTAILRRLGFGVDEKEDTLTVTPPSYRKWFDVTCAEDLVEEIGRFIGYKEITIEPALVRAETPRVKNPMRTLEHSLRSIATNRLNLNEVMSYAFHSKEDLNADEFFAKATEATKMQNAINEQMNFLRISPLPGLLRTIHSNYRGEKNVRIFEIEKIFLPSEDKNFACNEEYFFAIALTSTKSPEEAAHELTAIAAEILFHAGLMRHEQVFTNAPNPIFHPGISGSAGSKDKTVFRFGQIHPRLLGEYGIKERVYYADALLKRLLSIAPRESHYRAPFVYPAVDFDLTLVMPKQTEFAAVKAVIGPLQPLVRRDLDKTVVVAFDYVSTFTGGNLPEDKKALSVRTTWRNPTRTLTGEEIKKLQDGLIARMQKAGFSLR